MPNIETLHDFLTKAHEMFPTEEGVNHSITLSDDKETLQVNILVAELNQFWYIRPETDDEWINATESLTELKTATLLVINEMKDES